MSIHDKRMLASDVIFKLKVKDDKLPKSSIGLSDSRLFTGENRLHAIMDKQTCLWTLRYDFGIVPHTFKQRFTSLARAVTFVTDYYQRRNIEITEILDTNAVTT